ncbi:MAG: glycosyltransferase family 4 protein [Candidatus Pacebacteria bacterium]|nr:glycosyltransferase family 4 protein [Candidatus Paceibacterota bacterium]MCF7856935.1 glycosyltransferase family 4 protein [Candidatus Paceibacterota bacterium]
MAKKIYDWLDPSKQAADYLNTVLERDDVLKGDQTLDDLLENDDDDNQSYSSEIDVEVDTKTTPRNARNEPKILSDIPEREQARLLFLTKDTTIMQEGSLSNRRIADLRSFFLEVHVVVLTLREEEDVAPVRLFDNVWLYATNSRSPWRMAYDAYVVVKTQLIFGGGFRADVIIAEDTFETGLVGCFFSKKHKRPLQVHISEDFFVTSFIEAQEYPLLYEWATRYVLKHATSVRTKTEFQRQAAILEYPDLTSVTEILPNYYNLEGWKNFVPTVNLRERYPQFKFTLLNISSMRKSSRALEALIGAAKILHRYPVVGLIMVGNGPMRAVLERYAISLGVQKQVEFEPLPTEVLSFMRSTNVLLHLSEDGEDDDFILEAAVARLPMVANKDGIAGQLFVDEESACLCAATDIECIANSINRYLNENQDRALFTNRAYDIVFERVEQDYGEYIKQYAESIQRCVVKEG